MLRAFCTVALLALALLLLRAGGISLAGDYIDPLSHISAQDEALYSHSAIAMARQGEWLTPRFMGRYALYKPPLLIWAAALSTRAFGIFPWSLRLPAALLAALSLGLLFLWAAELSGLTAGAMLVALVLSNHLWLTLCGLCLTDGLLLSFGVAAFYALFTDPWLESRACFFGFAAAVAGAILTKGIAGILPLIVLGFYWLAARPNERPTFLRITLVAALAIAFAAPWFLYQYAVHPRWFWTEHIAVEILGYGGGAPPQTSRENPVLFYFMRLAATDPPLLAAACLAIPNFLRALRRRGAPAVLLACWIAAVLMTTLAWQYRNMAYLLPLVPALAVLAAVWGPFASPRYSRWMLAGMAAFLLVKVNVPDAPWGLNFQSGSVQPTAPALSAYCAQARGNPLIVVDLADDLYASTLPLARLRYTAVVPISAATGPYEMPFPALGISVTADQFRDLPALMPGFRTSLREWSLDSAAPVATLITVKNPAELGALASAHADTDFLVPSAYRHALQSAPQEYSAASLNYFLLLSRIAVPRAQPPQWTCKM
jgi:Dolichyl-phosphate-mannose-protein mannosyltransferase